MGGRDGEWKVEAVKSGDVVEGARVWKADSWGGSIGAGWGWGRGGGWEPSPGTLPSDSPPSDPPSPNLPPFHPLHLTLPTSEHPSSESLHPNTPV